MLSNTEILSKIEKIVEVKFKDCEYASEVKKTQMVNDIYTFVMKLLNA